MRAFLDIAAWLDGQDPRVQEHLATALLPFLGYHPEEIAARSQHPASLLDEWLTTLGNTSFRVGRLLTFRSLVTFCAGERFAGDGWQSVEEIYKSVLLDPRSRQVTREWAEQCLAALPALKVEWVRAGSQWEELVSTSLSDLSLRVAIVLNEVESVTSLPSAGEPIIPPPLYQA